MQKKIQPVLQAETTECGLACVVMIAQMFGVNVELRELRRTVNISRNGAGLRQLIDVLERLGIGTRAIRLELQELKLIKLPAVLHWDMSHFVVLEKVSGSEIHVLDPACGRRSISMKDTSSHFSGVALETFSIRADIDKARENRSGRLRFHALAGRLIGVKRAMLQVIALALAIEAFALSGPLFMQWVVDQAIVAGDSGLVLSLAFGFFLLLILQASLTFFRNWFAAQFGTSISVQWGNNLYAHLLSIAPDFFARRSLGDVITRFQSISSIQRILTTNGTGVVIDGVLSLITLCMMAFYNKLLALLPICSTAVYLILRAATYSKVKESTNQLYSVMGKQQSHLYESVRAIQTIKLLGIENVRSSVFSALSGRAARQQLSLQSLEVGMRSLNQAIFGIERIWVVALGATMVIDQRMSVGMLVAFLAYKDQFTTRASALVDAIAELRTYSIHGNRVADIALEPPELDKTTASFHGDSLENITIELRDIRFRYSESDPWILNGVSMKIEQGESVVLAGPSGGGKSTLLKVVLGLIKPCEGEILINGRSLSNFGVERLRALTGTIMQEDHLFSGTVADNVDAFDFQPDSGRMIDAARAAAIHDDITRLPIGYLTPVGDMGAALSGGQKQRILLARALYRRPRLLVLDEATSHLDPKKEEEVSESLRGMNITRLMVAHRAETIAMADRVLTLVDGRLR